MRLEKWICVFLLSATLAAGQETRGNISGTVVDAQGGLIAGATVVVANVDTGVSTQIKTNTSGYYLATLLIPGNYQVTVEAPGFKRSVRSGLILAVSQDMDLDLTLEVGQVSDSVTVSAEAPLLDTASVTAGQNLDRRSVEALPVFANMTVLLTRFVPGVWASSDVNYTAQGYVSRTSDDYNSLGRIGGSEWTIDGATNNGAVRRLASSPNSEMIQEMRVETANFDASFGHGTGLGISMMTRSGTNDVHGSANWQYWNNRWNGAKLFQRQIFYRNIANAEASGDSARAAQMASQPILPAGFGKSVALTFGGPVYIPKVINGRDKLFFFFNFSWNHDYRVGAAIPSGVFTLPTMANRAGDFSQLLKIGSRYQIYDPLTVRADPARPGHYIREPFGGNIIPPNRRINPMYDAYVKFLPVPNSDPLDPSQEPLNNYRNAGDRDPIYNKILGNRLDYNLSEKHRFFSRWSWSRFTEGLRDWTWESVPGLLSDDTLRRQLSGTADWTFVKSARTIIDTQISANTFYEGFRRLMLASYKPTDVGLPAYMDQRCAQTGGCTLPVMSWSGYTALGPGAATGNRVANVQGNLGVTQIFGEHTLRYGADIREAYRTNRSPGATAGRFGFDNTYTRKNDDTAVAPAGNVGLSWAAFMLGIPSSLSIDDNDTYATAAPYYAGYVQDAWRLSRTLTLNLGLRFEFEQAMTERYDRMLVGWDPSLKLPISDAAAAAYATSALPEVPASSFRVQGGSLYANSQGAGRRAWKDQAMLLPRVALSWQLNQKTVVRTGYGVYYDTLNPTAIDPNQLGYSATTTNVASNDFGLSWNMGNPGAGISLLANPFPVRADGTRYESAYRNTLGAMMVAGTSYAYGNLNREHSKVQRWRASVQRELTSNMAVEVVYTGMYSGNADLRVRQDVLPEQYWNGTMVRNSALATELSRNIKNPFYIDNFQSLKTSDRVLYSRLASVPFFNSSTVQKNRLLRPFPHMSSLEADALPIQKMRIHSLDVLFQRRFSSGLSLNLAFAAIRADEWSTIFNEYEKAPTQWLTSDDAKPYRFSASGVYQLPFGKGRTWWQQGVLNAIAGGWQTGATFEWQPGPLLSWGNLFFYGNVDDIGTGTRTLNRWFNIDAGFERDNAKAPAAYQKRVFPTQIDGLRQDKLQLLNANVQKSIPITERVQLQLRLDAANAFNRSHFNPPDRTPTSTQFGMVTNNSVTINRWITVVGRLQF